MANSRGTAWETYLVEHYRPGLDAGALQRTAELLRRTVSAMESEGSAVRHVRSTIVPNDEAFMSVLEAASESVVREAYARAGLAFERISRAVQVDD